MGDAAHKCGAGLEGGHTGCEDVDWGVLMSEEVNEAFPEKKRPFDTRHRKRRQAGRVRGTAQHLRAQRWWAREKRERPRGLWGGL